MATILAFRDTRCSIAGQRVSGHVYLSGMTINTPTGTDTGLTQREATELDRELRAATAELTI